MTWTEAVATMMRGPAVYRTSERKREMTTVGDMQVVDTGVESIRIMAAWTWQDRPAHVFVGADSRYPFVPSDEDMLATDWEEDAK